MESREAVVKRRLEHLQSHLKVLESKGEALQVLDRAPCASTIRRLPRFDATKMEALLDDLVETKAEVYETFTSKPELLIVGYEGLTKGMCLNTFKSSS